ncbi:MAG TPA: PTS sugar transporter subunit IIA [Candidatus Eisenbacteria bacterium]|nr:PTS sugar transporter subunit IIA [Candidatus Eisenbacteria bacterium]
MTSPSLSATKTASSLESLLRPTHFVSELRFKKKAHILDELAAALASAGVTRSPDLVAELLREREALGSTGVGKGIAVPHARSTLIAERAVVVARSRKGIDFEAVDGEPVHLLFLVVAPPMERDPIYLKVLADVVRAVRLSRTRQKLSDAPDFETVREILIHAASE